MPIARSERCVGRGSRWAGAPQTPLNLVVFRVAAASLPQIASRRDAASTPSGLYRGLGQTPADAPRGPAERGGRSRPDKPHHRNLVFSSRLRRRSSRACGARWGDAVPASRTTVIWRFLQITERARRAGWRSEVGRSRPDKPHHRNLAFSSRLRRRRAARAGGARLGAAVPTNRTTVIWRFLSDYGDVRRAGLTWSEVGAAVPTPHHRNLCFFQITEARRAGWRSEVGRSRPDKPHHRNLAFSFRFRLPVMLRQMALNWKSEIMRRSALDREAACIRGAEAPRLQL